MVQGNSFVDFQVFVSQAHFSGDHSRLGQVQSPKKPPNKNLRLKQDFCRPAVLPSTQPTVSKHWRGRM